MFPLFQSKHVLNVYKIHYCEGDFQKCARYKSASSGVMPPGELLPDGTTMARPDKKLLGRPVKS